jgi:hypothetical protein
MIDALIHLVRVARPADSGAVSALLVASYSSLLGAHYDSYTLGRALPIMTKANPTLLAFGTYYVRGGRAGQSCWMRRLDDSETGKRRGH